MSLSKWALAVIGVSALVLTSGCWARAYDLETKTRLDGDYEGLCPGDAKVFVNDWTVRTAHRARGSQMESSTTYVLDQGHSTYDPVHHGYTQTFTQERAVTTAHQVPDSSGPQVERVTELKPLVEEKMRENGFSVADSKLLADYSLVLDYNDRKKWPIGMLIWDGFACIPGLFTPFPLFGGTDAEVTITVYDNKDRQVASRLIVCQEREYWLSDWSMIAYASHKYDVYTRVAANTACAIIADDRQLGGDLEKVKSRLRENPSFVSVRGADYDTPLHWAARQGRKDVVEFLLANKADINAKNKSGQTPLHAAAVAQQKEMVDLLRQHGGQE